jgi:hypothetical protein
MLSKADFVLERVSQRPQSSQPSSELSLELRRKTSSSTRWICSQSEFISEFCDARLKSKSAKAIPLANFDLVSPEAFTTYLAWLQTGDIKSSAYYIGLDPSSLRSDDLKTKYIDRYHHLVHCYILGAFFEAKRFNTAITALLAIMRRVRSQVLRCTLQHHLRH